MVLLFPILFWPWKRRAEISIAQLCRKSVIIPTHIFAITLSKNIFPVIQELYFVCFARHGIYIKTSTSRELFNRPSKSWKMTVTGKLSCIILPSCASLGASGWARCCSGMSSFCRAPSWLIRYPFPSRHSQHSTLTLPNQPPSIFYTLPCLSLQISDSINISLRH